MMSYLRTEGKYNVYEFLCPHCGIRGEVGVPLVSTLAFDHGCGSNVFYIQRKPCGMFANPRLEEVYVQRGAQA